MGRSLTLSDLLANASPVLLTVRREEVEKISWALFLEWKKMWMKDNMLAHTVSRQSTLPIHVAAAQGVAGGDRANDTDAPPVTSDRRGSWHTTLKGRIWVEDVKEKN